MIERILFISLIFVSIQSYPQSNNSVKDNDDFRLSFSCLFEYQDYSVYANIGTLSNVEINKNVVDFPTSYGINFQLTSKLNSYFSLNYGFGIRETFHKFYYVRQYSSDWEWFQFIIEKSIGDYLEIPVDFSFNTKTTKRLFIYSSIGLSPAILLSKYTGLTFKNDNYKYLIKPPGSDFRTIVGRINLDFGLGLRINNQYSIIISALLSNQTKYYTEELTFEKPIFVYGFKLILRKDQF
jgi:hypothetical protein